MTDDSSGTSTGNRRSKKSASAKRRGVRAAKGGSSPPGDARRPPRYPDPTDEEIADARELGMRIGPAPLGQKSEPVDPSAGTTSSATSHDPMIRRDDDGRVTDLRTGTTYDSLVDLLRAER